MLRSLRALIDAFALRYPMRALVLLALISTSGAQVIYSGLQAIAIATGFEGTYINFETGENSTSDFAGSQLNAFFGGAGVATTAQLQPVRIGTGEEDALLRLNAGAIVDGSRLYWNGDGGSGSHLGPGATQFQPGQEAYLGFKLFTAGSVDPYYGWARVVFTANQPGGVIEDWAYDTSGGAINAGGVLQGPAVGGQQTLTLSAGLGESYTLGTTITDLGGNVNSLLKTGAGTWKLTGINTYSGSTTITGGVLELITGAKLSLTSSVNIQTGGTLLLSGTGGTNTKLNPLANVTLAGGALQLDTTTQLDQQLGILTLTANSTLDFGTLAGGNTLHFGDSSSSLWTEGATLNVLNWTTGEDHLFFGTTGGGLSFAQMGQISFFSDNGSHFLGTGQFGFNGELVPIPEPSTWFAGALLVGVVTWRERKRFFRQVK